MRTPLPNTATGGRPFNTDTNLGKIMAYLHMSVRQLAAESGVSERLISNYLAGRREIPAPNVAAFAKVFDCDPVLVLRQPVKG